MDFSEKTQNPMQQFGGLALVILLHVFIIYALVSGLARKAAHVVAPELVAEIVEPVKPPPPPPPPPPKTPPPPPRVAAPPPPFVPPPEVKVSAPPPPNPIAAVSNVQPESPILPPPAPPVEAPPAKVAPRAPVHVAGINDLNSCRPEYPRASQAAEETGITRIEFVVSASGELIDAKVKKSSGSRTLDRAAVAGLSKCTFHPGTQDGVPVQSTFAVEYVWKIEN